VKERKRKRKREIKNHLQKSSLSRGKKSKQNEPFKKLKRHLKKRRVNMILNLISSLILFLYFFFFSNMINSNFFSARQSAFDTKVALHEMRLLK